jgi:SAM-dependent methyltransferase
MTDYARWLDPNEFMDIWDKRAKRAAEFIPRGSTVLDLGCGKMAIQGFLPRGCRYIGCDLTARSEDTVVCDFNRGEFPKNDATVATVITMLGLLEYIIDIPRFFANLGELRPRRVIASYHPTDLYKKKWRDEWLSHLSERELLESFEGARLKLKHKIRLPNSERLYVFRAPRNIFCFPALRFPR